MGWKLHDHQVHEILFIVAIRFFDCVKQVQIVLDFDLKWK